MITKHVLCDQCRRKLIAPSFFGFKHNPSRKQARRISKLVADLVKQHGEVMLIREPSFYLQHEVIFAEDAFGKIIGVITVIDWGNGDFEIASHAVHSDYRGTNLGGILFRKIMKKIRRKPKRVFLFTKTPAYYERFGFVRTDPEQFAKKIQEDCAPCPRGPRPGFPPCPEVAMRLPDGFKKKNSELRC